MAVCVLSAPSCAPRSGKCASVRPGCTRVRVVTTECAALTAGARPGPSQASERESKEVKVMAGSSQAHQAGEVLWVKLEQSILLSLSDRV